MGMVMSDDEVESARVFTQLEIGLHMACQRLEYSCFL